MNSSTKDTFTMSYKEQKMIATIVKEKRKELGYTQQEVSDITKISLRSIQRIEKGAVMPRMHTLKALAESLDFSLDVLNPDESHSNAPGRVSIYRKVILSISSALIIVLLSFAFVAQSNRFPETNFEFLIYCTSIVAVISIIWVKIWDPKKIVLPDKTLNKH